MFDPTMLVSPLTTVLEALKRQNGGYRSLLLTKNNVEFLSAEYQPGEFNTKVYLNELDITGSVVTRGREINYNRVDFNHLIDTCTIPVVQRDGTTMQHLVSYRDLSTIRNPTVQQLVDVLNAHYDLPITDVDLIVVEPEITDGGDKLDQPRLVNGLIEDEIYTYVGGQVVIEHRNICPQAHYSRDIDFELGLQFVRKQYAEETLKLTLPFIGLDDAWTIMFESLILGRRVTNGHLWFKLQLDNINRVWALHAPDIEPVWFNANAELILTITKMNDVITVTGKGVDGTPTTATIACTPAMTYAQVQRVSAYTRNPIPRILQFRLESSDVVDTTVRYDIIEPNVLSNAIYNTINNPIIITDATCVNYIEDEINYYLPNEMNVTRGSVTKYTQVTSTFNTQLDVNLLDFINLCLTGKLKRILIHAINVNDPTNYCRVEYVVQSVDTINKTMNVIIVANGVASEVRLFRLYDFSGLFRVRVTVDDLVIYSSYATLGVSVGRIAGVGPHQYKVTVDVELTQVGTLPVMLFNKAQTTYIPTPTPL